MYGLGPRAWRAHSLFTTSGNMIHLAPFGAAQAPRKLGQPRAHQRIYIYICFGRLCVVLRGRQHKSGSKAYIYIYIYGLGPQAGRAHSIFDSSGARTGFVYKKIRNGGKSRRIIQSDLTRSTARRGRRILMEYIYLPHLC